MKLLKLCLCLKSSWVELLHDYIFCRLNCAIWYWTAAHNRGHLKSFMGYLLRFLNDFAFSVHQATFVCTRMFDHCRTVLRNTVSWGTTSWSLLAPVRLISSSCFHTADFFCLLCSNMSYSECCMSLSWELVLNWKEKYCCIKAFP
jgi:hypothetical protein